MVEQILRDPRQKASYTSMEAGTKEEYLKELEIAKPFRARTAERVLEQLSLLHFGFPGGQVDRYEHSLQTATRAFRDGQDEEIIVAALLHDLGDRLAPDNHPEVAAAVVKPYVSWQTHWVVLQHGLFQGYYYLHHYGKNRNERDKFRGHPAYQTCVDFCAKYDQVSNDPNFDTMPLSAFIPMVQRVFSREPWGAITKAPMESERAGA